MKIERSEVKMCIRYLMKTGMLEKDKDGKIFLTYKGHRLAMAILVQATHEHLSELMHDAKY